MPDPFDPYDAPTPGDGGTPGGAGRPGDRRRPADGPGPGDALPTAGGIAPFSPAAAPTGAPSDTTTDQPETPAPATEPPADAGGPAEKARSLWSDAWHDLRRNPIFVISSLVIVFLVLIAIWPSSSPTATRTRPTWPRPRKAPNQATRSASTSRVAMSTPAPSTEPAPRSPSVSAPPRAPRCSAA